MKQIGFTLMLVVVVLSPLAAACQGAPKADRKSDWGEVQSLPRGFELDVKRTDGLSAYCVFDGATDETLFCNSRQWSRRGEFRVERSQVKQIRMARSANRVNNIVKTSGAVGAIAGAALPANDGSERIIDAIAGGAGGLLVGCILSVPSAFIPGKLIYRQPKRAGRGAAPASPHGAKAASSLQQASEVARP